MIMFILINMSKQVYRLDQTFLHSKSLYTMTYCHERLKPNIFHILYLELPYIINSILVFYITVYMFIKEL
jgi:hypothetical protein